MGNRNAVILDPGHGGKDSGAIGKYDGKVIYEKDITLNIALYAKEYLNKFCRDSLDVVLTRCPDQYVSLIERCERGLDYGLVDPADLFVSIHCNSFEEVADTTPGVTGIETFYYWDDARIIAHIMQRNLIKNFHSIDRGIKRGRYYVIKENIPEAVLVECEFIDEKAEWLNMSGIQENFGSVIGESIREYFLC